MTHDTRASLASEVRRRRLGPMLTAQGDLAAALNSYQTAHAIFDRLAAADPGLAAAPRASRDRQRGVRARVMQDAALFFRSRAVACFHRRRKYAALSPEWRHEVKEAREFIRYCRANWDDRPREITRTAYALGPNVRLQRMITCPQRDTAGRLT